MARFTHQEYQAFLVRRTPRNPLSGGGVTKESELHADIIDECKRRGWIVFHGSMAHQTFRTPGEPDLIILRDGGGVLMVECKTAKGKLSPEQLAIHAWAAKLGKTIHVVRSMDEFLCVIQPSN